MLAALEELRARNVWLIRMRWLAAVVLAAATTVARYLLHLLIASGVLYAGAVFLLVYNAVFFLLARGRLKAEHVDRELSAARILATLQMVIDLVVLTVMLHYSGGVENPFFLYFIFHMIIGSILLGRSASFYIATFAVALFSALVLCEYCGAVRHYPLWSSGLPLHENPAYVFAVLAVFATTMYLSVYFAGSIVEKLRLRDAELIGVTSSLEKGSLELAEAYEKIRALEERKSSFLRLVAHQLRSPLGAIRSLLDVVLGGYARDPAEERDTLQRAHYRTDLMLAMLDDLLSLSRLKDAATAESAASERVDVAAIVRDLETLYRPRADEKNLRLTVSPARSPAAILANADDVRQAINNLLDNAINYTPSGGSVTASAETAGANVVVRVADTGIGIAEESLGRLFEEFYRAPNAKTAVPHGTGLGLAIVKRAVEKWNGTVKVESKLGAGTAFTIEFPSA
jgi:signal transduction histidine kinase